MVQTRATCDTRERRLRAREERKANHTSSPKKKCARIERASGGCTQSEEVENNQPRLPSIRTTRGRLLRKAQIAGLHASGGIISQSLPAACDRPATEGPEPTAEEPAPEPIQEPEPDPAEVPELIHELAHEPISIQEPAQTQEPAPDLAEEPVPEPVQEPAQQLEPEPELAEEPIHEPEQELVQESESIQEPVQKVEEQHLSAEELAQEPAVQEQREPTFQAAEELVQDEPKPEPGIQTVPQESLPEPSQEEQIVTVISGDKLTGSNGNTGLAHKFEVNLLSPGGHTHALLEFYPDLAQFHVTSPQLGHVAIHIGHLSRICYHLLPPTLTISFKGESNRPPTYLFELGTGTSSEQLSALIGALRDRVPIELLEPPTTERVKTIVNTGDPTVLLCVNGANLTRGDFNRLAPGMWLNDNVIFWYTTVLAREIPEQNKGRVWILDPLFYTTIKQRPTSPIHRTRSFFAHDFIVVPVQEGKHWFLMVACHLKQAILCAQTGDKGKRRMLEDDPQIVVLDSRGSKSAQELGPAAVKTFRQFLRSRLEWELEKEICGVHPPSGKAPDEVFQHSALKCQVNKTMDQHRQVNGCDCGVYLLQYAESICLNPPVETPFYVGGTQFTPLAIARKRVELQARLQRDLGSSS
eukprot:TRINITY_DN1910_c0_g1_i3.p1 TRINITY_DN1910_c0_g1~~TRINITY_DN1910_c0_g1_i3.p1  ORF type:complete len:640 (-),score=95.28 TRINITY_DN1910_c0_g1_i3:234-2153(-)